MISYENDIKHDNSSNLLKNTINISIKRHEHVQILNVNKLAYQKLFHQKQSNKYYNPLS